MSSGSASLIVTDGSRRHDRSPEAESESVLQPEWSPRGDLYFVSDRSGWWNLYRARGEGDEPLCPRSAEFGAPQWGFGMRFYAFTGPDEIVCLYSEPGGTKLGRIDVNTGAIEQVHLLYTNLNNIQATRTRSLFSPGPQPGRAVSRSSSTRARRRLSRFKLITR